MALAISFDYEREMNTYTTKEKIKFNFNPISDTQTYKKKNSLRIYIQYATAAVQHTNNEVANIRPQICSIKL